MRLRGEQQERGGIKARLETGAACSGARTYGSRLTGVASLFRGRRGGVTSELADN